MADPQQPPGAVSGLHLAAAPRADLWTAALCFDRFDSLLAETATPAAAEAALVRSFKGRASRAVARRVIARSGGGSIPTQHLVLVGAFTELTHSDAIEAVAIARLGEAAVSANRKPSGRVRRHALMVLLYEADLWHMFEVGLWHRHFLRRRCRYRLGVGQELPRPLEVSAWQAAARASLEGLREGPDAGCREFDAVRVAPGPIPGDVLVALRTWPTRCTGRGRDGEVTTVALPDWTTLHFAEQGRRLEVSDQQVQRGVTFAVELAGRLAGRPRQYHLVLEELTSPVLDAFLARITDPTDRTFPLVEMVAEAPWRPHQVVTLTGTRETTAEGLVGDLRQLHLPFARDWRTVKSAKLSFEGRHTIQVHFPPPGEPTALSYSDDGRSEQTSFRFAKLLEEHLHVEVAAKARRGARKGRKGAGKKPRKHSLRWWRAVLSPQTDRPAEWLEGAVAGLVSRRWLRLERVRAFRCNSPYIDRATCGVDSLDCAGDVVLPFDLARLDDATQLEDDGEVVCSTGLHRWRPMRYGLPTFVRLRVEVEHCAMFGHLAAELGRYGEVRDAPGRPGVLTVRLDDVVGTLVYVPLAPADELDPDSHGKRSPVAWVTGPGARPPFLSDGSLELAEVLADLDRLAARWGTKAWKRRRTRPARIEPPSLAAESAPRASGSATTVLTLTHRGVALGSDGQRITSGRHCALRVLWALWQAAVQDEGDRTARQLWSWENLDALLPEEWRAPGLHDAERKKSWHTWVSRTRKALRQGTGERGLGKRVVVSRGSKYRLGDGFVVADQRLQAETRD